jgi:hypothetical protein
MAFFQRAVGTLQKIVVALVVGLGIWRVLCKNKYAKFIFANIILNYMV